MYVRYLGDDFNSTSECQFEKCQSLAEVLVLVFDSSTKLMLRAAACFVSQQWEQNLTLQHLPKVGLFRSFNRL